MSASAVMLATSKTEVQPAPDTRRITEDDPDFQRLHSQTVSRLQRSLRQYAREVQRGEPGADTRFINRHIGLLRQAYEAAHHEGQRDYWPAVSNRTVQHRYIQPDADTTNKRLAFYALGSVLKMAHEVKSYTASQQSGATVTTARYDEDAWLLYNPNHDSKGRFTYGSGGPAGQSSGTSKGYKIRDTSSTPGAGKTQLRTLMGRDLSDNEIGSLVGARPGDEVSLVGYEGGKGVAIYLTGANNEYEAERFLTRDANGNLVMHNSNIHVVEQQQGTGAQVFGRQVRGLSALGVDRIEANAAGDVHGGSGYHKYYGYNAWARLGYQAKLSSIEGLDRSSMPASLRGVHTIQGLMRTPEGRAWWRQHGTDWHGTFSLKSGSISRRALDHYLKTKGIKLSEWLAVVMLADRDDNKPGVEEIEWTENDDQITDDFWSKLPPDVPDDPVYPTTETLDQPEQRAIQFDDAGTGDDSLLPGGFDNRTVLQAAITWTGLNDGYSAAGASDSASPYTLLYWNLGEAKNHCFDCPNLAFGSPYDPPWYGAGSNQLTQTPGDGQTECGAACKCSLSYEYPDATGLDQLGQQIADKWIDWLPEDFGGGADIAAGGAGAPFLPNPAPGQPLNPVRINRGQAPPLPRRIDRLSPPPRGAVLTTDQKAALDDFRNSSAMWDTIRRQLPPAPSLFGVDDLPAPLPAWDLLTPEQQAVVTRIEQAQEKWLSATSALVPPPHFSADPNVAVGQWLDAVAKADWPVPSSEADSETAMMKWLDSVAKQDWPVPDTPNYDAEMQAFLDRAARQFREATDDGTILLYNPNHDAKGRFTYGAGAKTTVARGQGRTRRAGNARVTNAGAQRGLSKPGTTGAPSAHKAANLLDDSLDEEKVANLTNRLAGNKDFEALAAARGRDPEIMVVEMYGDWGMSAEAVNSQALSLAVRDEFGLKGTSDIRIKSNTDQISQVRREGKSVEELYAAHGAGYRAFARAQYNETQDYLASKGVSSLTVYRGSIYESDPGKGGIKWGKSGEANISIRPISSFSTNPDIADEFSSAFGNYRYSLMISADVPSSRIFSLPTTGLGEGYQQELLILGGTDRFSYQSHIEENT